MSPLDGLLVLECALFVLSGALLLRLRSSSVQAIQSLCALSETAVFAGLLGSGGVTLARAGRGSSVFIAALGGALALLHLLRALRWLRQNRAGDDWLDPLRRVLLRGAALLPPAAGLLAALLGAGWQSIAAAACGGLLLGGALSAWTLLRLPAAACLPRAGQLLTQALDGGVLVLDSRGRVSYHNPAAQAVFGAETLRGRPLAELLAIWWQPALQMWEEGQVDFECSPRGGNYRLRAFPLPDADPAASGGRLILIDDLSRQRALEGRLVALESTDALTGLVNRRRLLEIAAREVYRACRYHRALAVLMIQVDDFSALNDQYGHAAGEQVLATLAQRCRENIRLADSAGRWGEATFALLLPETNLEQGRLAAERIRRILAGLPIATQRGAVNVTLTAGVAALGEVAPLTVELLLDQAAGALYAARCGHTGVATAGSQAVTAHLPETAGAPLPTLRLRNRD